MMKILEAFLDEEIRSYTDKSGEQYLNMMDLARALYLPKNTNYVLSRVSCTYRHKSSGNKVGQPSWWVTQSGVYQMLFASHHSVAIHLQHWIYKEVLPSVEDDEKYLASMRAKIRSLESLKQAVRNSDSVGA